MNQLFANLLGASAIAVVLLAGPWSLRALAEDGQEGPIVSPPVKPDHFEGDVRDLPKLPPGYLDGVEVNPRKVDPDEMSVRPDIAPESEPDPAVQSDFHGRACSDGCTEKFQNRCR